VVLGIKVEVQGDGGKTGHDLSALHLGETGGVVGNGRSVVGAADHTGSRAAAESAAAGAESRNSEAFSRGSGDSAGHKAERNEHGRNTAHQARYVHEYSSGENFSASGRYSRAIPVMGIRTEFPLADLSSAGGKITRGDVDTRLRKKNQTKILSVSR
jgi:hypothetical protein